MRYSRRSQSPFKPAPARLINWSHPYADGLRICIPFQESGGLTQELATGKFGTVTTINWATSPKYGKGQDTANLDANCYEWSADPRWDFSLPPITMIAFGSRLQTPVVHTLMVASGISGSNRFAMFKTPANALRATVKWGTDAPVSSFTIGGGGIPFFCAASYDGANVRYFYNGQMSTVAYTTTPTTTGDPLKLGTSVGGTSGPLNAILCGVYVYARALSYSELFALYHDPYAFLIPFRRRRALVGTGPGGGGGTRRPVSIIT